MPLFILKRNLSGAPICTTVAPLPAPPRPPHDPGQPFAITLICTVVAPAQAARSTAGRYLRSRMPVLDGRGAENALAPASAATVHASLAICNKTMCTFVC